MARKAKIYFQDQLAGYLTETDNGYLFYYSKEYLRTLNPSSISLTLPLSEHTYHSKVLFPFFRWIDTRRMAIGYRGEVLEA